MKYATGVLVYNRPLHTALTLAYAFMNKSDNNDLFIFYGTYSTAPTPSKALFAMLDELRKLGVIDMRYMLDIMPQNTQGNVDTLMLTLTALDKYDCMFKIDDDVLIGKGTDQLMAGMLTKLEPDGVHMLMGQAVRAHMTRRSPFIWETNLDGHRIVQRSHSQCPMETYTAISKNMLPALRKATVNVSCGNARGTYGVYTKNVTASGNKVCLVLEPAITMQHIGLTTTIDTSGASRCWAPARDWAHDKIIDVPPFNFSKWEDSHKDDTQQAVTLELLNDLYAVYPEKYIGILDILVKHTKAYTPGVGDVKLPPDPGVMGGREKPVMHRRAMRDKQLRGAVPQSKPPSNINKTRIRQSLSTPRSEPQHPELIKARRKQAALAEANKNAAVKRLSSGQLVRRPRDPLIVVKRGNR